MPLDPDMQAVADAYAAAGPLDLSRLDPAKFRAATEALRLPAAHVPLPRVEELEIPGPAGPLRARLYAPRTDARLPLVVYAHGGGFMIGSIETHDPLCRALAKAGDCAVLSIDYRLAPEHKFPAAFDDAKAALLWVAGHAHELGCDRERLALAGDSAGGNLAAAVALDLAPHLRLAHVLMFYPALDPDGDRDTRALYAAAPVLDVPLLDWFIAHYLRDAADRSDLRVAPGRAPTLAAFPPATIITAEVDPLRGEGEAFAHRLAQAGRNIAFKRFDGVAHGFVSMLGLVAKAQDAVDYAGARLRAALAVPAAAAA